MSEPINARVVDLSPCVLWSKSLRNGYGNYRVNKKTFYAHRRACEETHGPPPTLRHLALHRCNNRACINGEHLYWGTKKDNAQDALTAGVLARGERHGGAVLTEDMVYAIRSNTLSSYKLAEKIGIAPSTIRGIRNGTGNWRWLCQNPSIHV